MSTQLENEKSLKYLHGEAEPGKGWARWQEITDPPAELTERMLAELEQRFYNPTINEVEKYRTDHPTATFCTPEYQGGKFIPTVSLIKPDGDRIQVPIIGIDDETALLPCSTFFQKMHEQIGNRLGALRRGAERIISIHTPNKEEVEKSAVPIIGAAILHRPYNHRDGIKYSIEKYGTFTEVDKPIPRIWQSLNIIYTSDYPELFYEGRMDESLTRLSPTEQIAFFYPDGSTLLFSFVPRDVYFSATDTTV